MLILGIDPGPKQSAYVVYSNRAEHIGGLDIVTNKYLRDLLLSNDFHKIAIEIPSLRGSIVWQQVIDTAFEAGRIIGDCWNFVKVNPQQWRRHITGLVNAKDVQVKQCLMARFGTKGTKKNPGKLYGVKSHIWDALGIAVYAGDCLVNK